MGEEPEQVPDLKGKLADYWERRDELNQILQEYGDTQTKRFLSLDSQVYRENNLDAKTKEMLGLVASTVLRCDDCISYHLVRCWQEGVNDKELIEALNIALVVGGSITIPHLRRAMESWHQMKDEAPRTLEGGGLRRLGADIPCKEVGQGPTRIINATEGCEEEVDLVPLTAEKMNAILNEVTDILGKDGEAEDKLQKTCELLEKEVEHYDWVGFYLTDKEKEKMLTLGPYVGDATEHVNIAFGVGICGQAADTKNTFVVQDVTQVTNYLSCSPTVKSEIVVPVLRGEEVLGELDIDSHACSPFNELDKTLLEKICDMVEPIL